MLRRRKPEQRDGITPAWAGKRSGSIQYRRRRWDHPRMGGEKIHLQTFKILQTGSPPHGRGKVLYTGMRIDELRITPAWAGKSPALEPGTLWPQDHPRMGGEKIKFKSHCCYPPGSPPHGRGKAAMNQNTMNQQGITPAWAGKSHPAVCFGRFGGDHPRMGGEKRRVGCYDVVTRGSPPHGRGKDARRSVPPSPPRITPAWAGKSQQNP